MGSALGMSVLASHNLPGFTFYRTLLIWPYALSHAVAGVIWGIILHPNVGLVSYWLARLTGIRLNWISDGNAALIVIILAASWKMLGYNIIFFVAALQNISKELTEAAAIDGATGAKCFWKVTFPLISPITFFLLIMNSLQAFFESFGLIDVLTQGGPARATEILVYKLYRDGFLSFRTGFASAQSLILFLVVAILTIAQFRYAGRKVFYQ